MVGDGQSLSAALEPVLAGLSEPKDRAFVQALSYGTVRWFLRLDRILEDLLERPLKPKHLDLRVLALVGLYQLAYMRVKPHAAVAETVAAASGGRRWARPLLNAVLRTYLRERERFDRLADACAIGSSAHPQWLLQAFSQDWPQDSEALVAAGNAAPPMVLRVDLRQRRPADYVHELGAADIEARLSPTCETAVILSSPIDVRVLPGFDEGVVSVQDSAAQLAAPLLDLKPGQRVLDACAAPGGKTLHILQTCPNVSTLVAVDVAAERSGRIRDNLERAGMKATVLTADASQPAQWWDGAPFDRVLLDAPCSGTGVIRRHPDIKLLRRPADIERLRCLQRRLLDAAWTMLAPGGMLLYSTCSLLRSENDNQIQRFLDTHADAREVPIDASWGRAVGYGRQILSGDAAMDGFYYARLSKAS